MIINKIFNNNVILANDLDKHEIIVMGCGIGFKKNVGDTIDKEKIEKTFILKEKDVSEMFKILLEDVPTEIIYLCYDIIDYAKNMINEKLSDYIYVALTDHINNAIKIYKDGVDIGNPLIWEIKKFYPNEFNIGIKALEFIKDELEIELPQDEAANIALHLINAQVNSSWSKMGNISSETKMVQDILNIIKYTYNMDLDEKSLSYERLVTHLRFFFERLNKKDKKKEKSNLDDDFLLKQVKEKYKNAYNCMLKIEKYLCKELDDEEKLYLTVHIQRITTR